jgi:hypothetical protein
MSRRRLALAGAVLALAVTPLAVTSCSSGKGSASSTTTTSPPTSAAASTTTTTLGPEVPGVPTTTLPPSSPTTVVSLTVCTASRLSASLGSPSGAAGTTYYQLALTNKSSSACVEEGYPGVSFVAGSDGHQVGAPAMRVPSATPAIPLSPGASAYALLGVGEAVNFANCQPTPVLGLRVYPPDSLTALYVPHSDTGCANTSVVTLSIHGLAQTQTT